ncbi:co-chaperone DjlA [Luminiphilus syltensis NOR5-1B]|uniref:Co-chaperone DjlA n=1 Tax=Luminiphilus syltensis NOR5-1B TaxID=565045 RepID=B8KUF6_9GAMM|nr:co-chaperone DjlA [Luminiphilus syltensis]EED36812.1 co-chaperone DjlA [Luminiphilus syltensis NOR5-1B]
MQQYAGKIIAGLIGFLTLGPVGLLFGLAIGHAFDRGLWQALQAASPEALAHLQRQFFETTFTLLGYVAKADGRVSEAEIAQAENLFRQVRLSPSQRQAAIQRFKIGAASGFDPQPTVRAFATKVGQRRQLQQTLFAFLASMALADGELQAAEREALHHIAELLGMPAAEVDRLVEMLSAQSRFHSGPSGHRARSKDSVADAYRALGVPSEATDSEVKKAYRKLMSENHPDKLIAKGVPDDLIRLATERSQEISTAYEVIRNARGLG